MRKTVAALLALLLLCGCAAQAPAPREERVVVIEICDTHADLRMVPRAEAGEYPH